MRRQFPFMVTVLVLACAGGQTASSANPAERQRVSNLVPFDVANCFPAKLDLGKVANEYTLQAAFRGARPFIQECLTDARVQNPAAPTKGKVTITLDGSGTAVAISGDGLQPAATACIEKVVRAQLEGVSAPAGGKPITFEGPFERDPGSMVRMGINDASDVQGTIRLAVPQWCSCFEPVRTAAPPELSGPVTVASAEVVKYSGVLKAADGGALASKAISASLQPSDPSGAPLATCINQKIEAMPLKSNLAELTVPVQILLVNSYGATSMAASVPPPIQFAQLDAVREVKQSEAFAALARRQQVANAYDAEVQAYQAAANSKDAKKRKSASSMVKDLKNGCAALVKADDEYTRALEAEMAVEQQAVTLAQGLLAKDPSWSEAEKASSGAVADTQKQIDASKQLRAANDKACPKEKF